MKGRFSQKCQCKRTPPVVNIVEMTYGYQVEVTGKCSVCGRPFKELQGKGGMVTNIPSKEEIIERAKTPEPPEQVTSTKPTIDPKGEVTLSFGEKMKKAKAKKKLAAEAKKLADEADLAMAANPSLY